MSVQRPRHMPWDIKATRLDDINGKRTYRVPVYRRLCDASLEKLAQTELETWQVIAHTAADAANWALDQTLQEIDYQPCEVYAAGPRGGTVYRYAGWYTSIGSAISRPNDKNLQAPLDLPRREQ